MRRPLALALATLLLLGSDAAALDAVVTKRTVRVPSFAFQSGEVIPRLDLGVETYGTLNRTRDNVVLIAHFLAGDSHAAGRYARTDPQRGWWDALIGPGKPIDTDRFYVVSTDLPCNLKAGKDPRVVTTGPSTVDPRTGRSYGLRFPKTTVRDMVHAQRGVLTALGVRRLKAVVGPSLGGMIAWQWAIEFPTLMDVVVPVSAPVTFSSLERTGFQNAALTVRADPSWLFGEYARYGSDPSFGVAMAMYGLSDVAQGRAMLLPWLLYTYVQRARQYDANHYLYMLDLHQDYDLGKEHGSRATAFRRVRARVAVVGFDDDEFIKASRLRAAGRELVAAGVRSRVDIVRGTQGHLSTLHDLGSLAPVLRRELR